MNEKMFNIIYICTVVTITSMCVVAIGNIYFEQKTDPHGQVLRSSTEPLTSNTIFTYLIYKSGECYTSPDCICIDHDGNLTDTRKACEGPKSKDIVEDGTYDERYGKEPQK